MSKEDLRDELTLERPREELRGEGPKEWLNEERLREGEGGVSEYKKTSLTR